jgi:hypothetical protein
MPVPSDAESSRPSRAGSTERSVQPRPRDGRARLRWRAVVHASQKLDPARGQEPVAWHLADCDDPSRADAHCGIGRNLIATGGNPDGHCQVAGVCPRCPTPTASDVASKGVP